VKSPDARSRLDLGVNFTGSDGITLNRAYFMDLYKDKVILTEYFPQEGWRDETLAEVPISSGQMHVLQIEHEAGTVNFYIDGNLVSLDRQPSLPDGSLWRDWQFEGFLAGPGDGAATLESYVDWVSIRPPSSAIPSETSGELIFEDRFEEDISNWLLDSEVWEKRQDEQGNHWLCVSPRDSYALAAHIEDPLWQDYVFEVEVKVVKFSEPEGGVIQARVNPELFSTYQFYFNPEGDVELYRKTESPGKWLDGMSQPKILEGQHVIRMELQGPKILVFLDGEQILRANEPDPGFFDRGGIEIGAGPNWDVCFDNVRVTALK